eukprot:16445667-Heterocapsa_arctica.AAC.1
MPWNGSKWVSDTDGWWTQSKPVPWQCTLCACQVGPKGKACPQCGAKRAWASRACAESGQASMQTDSGAGARWPPTAGRGGPPWPAARPPPPVASSPQEVPPSKTKLQADIRAIESAISSLVGDEFAEQKEMLRLK